MYFEVAKWAREAEKQRQKKKAETIFKIINHDFFSRAGKTMGEAGRDQRAENSGKISSYESLERCHDGAARARDVADAQCAEQTKARRSAEKLADEAMKKSTGNEERLKLDTGRRRLAGEHERRRATSKRPSEL